MEQQVPVRLVTALDKTESDEKKKVKRICLCGNAVHHEGDDIVGHPGTPWWQALNEAEEGEEVEVVLPRRTVRLLITAIKTEPVAIAA